MPSSCKSDTTVVCYELYARLLHVRWRKRNAVQIVACDLITKQRHEKQTVRWRLVTCSSFMLDFHVGEKCACLCVCVLVRWPHSHHVTIKLIHKHDIKKQQGQQQKHRWLKQREIMATLLLLNSCWTEDKCLFKKKKKMNKVTHF